LKPLVIRQGDYLLSLAHKFGFDADTVWKDPANADLQKLRPDPNILCPTDILHVPDESAAPEMVEVTTGTTNVFVSDAPMVTLTVIFADESLASQAFTVQELPGLEQPPTDASGKLTLSVPVTSKTATIVFTDAGPTFRLKIGHLDPIGTLSGIVQRLQNLGYIDFDAELGSEHLEFIRMALRAFLATASDSSSSPDGPASPPSDGSPTSDAAPSSSGPASPSDGAPLSSDLEQPDNAGLSEDGTLDEDTAAKLVAAHGS
jgi:hypothetical protein